MPLKKIGIAGIGDRRDEDIRECATIAARMFDHIITTRKIFKRKNRRRNNQSNTRGIASSGQDVTYEIIPKKRKQSSMP
jgi:cyanophycin synthetase